MHLPKYVKNEFSINYDYMALGLGDFCYFAPDGTVHFIAGHVGDQFILTAATPQDNHHSKDYWEIQKLDVQRGLYSDFFPLNPFPT